MMDNYENCVAKSLLFYGSGDFIEISFMSFLSI